MNPQDFVTANTALIEQIRSLKKHHQGEGLKYLYSEFLSSLNAEANRIVSDPDRKEFVKRVKKIAGV